MKLNLKTGILILATLVLAGIAIFTAIKLYQLRQKAIAPTAPEQAPAAGPQATCPQIITYAKDPTTGVCQQFPTPCDVPPGWIVVPSCEEVSPTPTPTPIEVPVCSLTFTLSTKPTSTPTPVPTTTQPTNTPTPTVVSATPTPTIISAASPTSQQLPSAGTALPTFGTIFAGLLLLGLGLLFAF